MNKRKLVLGHRGVKIYHSWKGAQALDFWYALVPNHRAEGGGQDFDVRSLPERYRRGLVLENTSPVSDPGAYAKGREAMLEAHRQAIRRAIEDGHDFLARPGPLSRLLERMRSLTAARRSR
ncbi:hypothetical protein [Labrys wisconsinensis]|uniref:Uncharacterized protein n=1 Tax=Labrys wisconsinensis TaxID=425677 RepID=A0ABU0JII3_9HYPH|nr:hypothetical protein [Labrys wisconsinensis]MDQ0474083.1 hypothetical protein [Labrys wisconsinensis]